MKCLTKYLMVVGVMLIYLTASTDDYLVMQGRAGLPEWQIALQIFVGLGCLFAGSR